MGFSPGKSFFAIVSLMMTARGASGRSRQLKSRPCLIGMPRASKNPGEVVERTAMVRSLTGGSGRPSTAAGERVFPPSAEGRVEAAEAWVTPGSGFEFLDGVLEEEALPLDIRIRTWRQSDEKGGDAFGAETGIDFLQTAETVDQQDGADEQDERKRDFGDEQNGAEAARLPPGCPARRIFQRIDRIAPRGMKRRDETQDEAGDEGKRQREPEHVQVESDFQHARDEVFRDLLEQIEAPDGKERSENPSDARGQHALSQELQDDASARRAERGADGDLFPARGEPGQQKIRDIRAGDEQHAADRGEKGEQHRPLRSDKIFMEGDDAHAGFRVHLLGIRGLVAAVDDVHLFVGLRAAHARASCGRGA